MVLATVGCRPTFEPNGTLWFGGAPWRPTECHVLTCGTGIELFGPARGGHLELTIPPQTLKAWQTIGGAANVRWTGTNGSPVDLGQCASLTMRGEGYHGSGKRAASGRVSLSCRGTVAVSGDLDFSGCF
jgi:hypothetical protein